MEQSGNRARNVKNGTTLEPNEYIVASKEMIRNLLTLKVTIKT